MTERLAGYVRTAATLGVLALLLLYAVTRGFDAVSKPFPQQEDPPVCVESVLSRNDVLRVGGITVSVINAGDESGLARRTLDDLVAQGFDAGEVSNMRDPAVRTAEIRVVGGATPAARLVRTYLGGRAVKVVDRSGTAAGLTLVVGDQFAGIKNGRPGIRIREESSVCGPAELG